jgi:hypothetical protein
VEEDGVCLKVDDDMDENADVGGVKLIVGGVYRFAMGWSLCPLSRTWPFIRMTSMRRGWKKCWWAEKKNQRWCVTGEERTNERIHTWFHLSTSRLATLGFFLCMW